MNYYFAKLNINQNIFVGVTDFKNIKDKLIPNKFKSYSKVEMIDNILKYKDKKNEWTFTDLVIDSDYIEGNLTKEHIVAITTVEGSQTRDSPSKQADTAHFFYEINSELLIFHETKGIKKEKFLIVFAELLSLNDDSIGELQIKLLTRNEEFKDVLLSSDVYSITLNYVIPNSKRAVNKIGAILEESRATKGQIKIENKHDGINVGNEREGLATFTKDILEISEKGYGEVNADISRDGAIVNIKTDQYPIKLNVDSSKINNINEKKTLFSKFKNRWKKNKNL